MRLFSTILFLVLTLFLNNTFADSFAYCGWDSGVNCPAPDKDGDGYATDGSGLGFDCDDSNTNNSHFIYPGEWTRDGSNYKKCKTDGTYDTPQSTPCDALGSGTCYYVDFDKTTSGDGSFSNPFRDMSKLGYYLRSADRPSGWIQIQEGDHIIWKGKATVEDEYLFNPTGLYSAEEADDNHLIRIRSLWIQAELDSDHSSGVTTLNINNSQGTWPATGTVRIGRQSYAYTAKTSSTVTLSSTTTLDYPEGAIVAVEKDIVWIMAWPGETAEVDLAEKDSTTYTLDGAHSLNDKTITLNETISTSLPERGNVRIGDIEYHYESFSGKGITLDAGSPGLRSAESDGDPVVFWKSGNTDGAPFYFTQSNFIKFTGGTLKGSGTMLRVRSHYSEANNFIVTENHGVDQFNAAAVRAGKPTSTIDIHHAKITNSYDFADYSNINNMLFVGFELDNSNIHHLMLGYTDPNVTGSTSGGQASCLREKHGSAIWKENSNNKYFSNICFNSPRGFVVAGSGSYTYNNYAHVDGSGFTLKDQGGTNYAANNVFENNTARGEGSKIYLIDYSYGDEIACSNNQFKKGVHEPLSAFSGNEQGHIINSIYHSDDIYDSCIGDGNSGNGSESAHTFSDNVYVEAPSSSSQFCIFASTSNGNSGDCYNFANWKLADTSTDQDKPIYDADSDLVSSLNYSFGVVTTSGSSHRGYQGSLGADETGMLAVTTTTTSSTSTTSTTSTTQPVNSSVSGGGVRAGCGNWRKEKPHWIWCDDFEDDTPMSSKYYDYDPDGGDFVLTSDDSKDGNRSLKATWQNGEVDAGHFVKTFGKNPANSKQNQSHNFTNIYWRYYAKLENGFNVMPDKWNRLTGLVSSDWRQSFVAHYWEGGTGFNFSLDPVSGVNNLSQVATTTYNDFANFSWLGNIKDFVTTILPDTWYCLEGQVKLNTPGNADGVMRMWVDEVLEGEDTTLNFVESYTDYGINAMFVSNYINAGSTQEQSRWMDSFVIATERIYCDSFGVGPGRIKGRDREFKSLGFGLGR